LVNFQKPLIIVCWWVIVFVLAVIPRIANLDYFLMVDENLWYERSARFMLALLSGDFAQTAQTGHPGVTTMWSGVVGLLFRFLQDAASASTESLWQFAARMSNTTGTLATIGCLRLPLALFSALTVVLAFGLTRRLIGFWPALLGAVLMAMEPFYLAHSRVLHHDSPTANFSLLALLSWLLYLKEQRRWSFVLAAASAALAILSKISSLFLLAFFGLTLLILCWREALHPASFLRRVAIPWLQMAIVALAVIMLVWPALWAAPQETLGIIIDFIEKEKGAHGGGSFFLGRPVLDPGVLYYPVALSFVMTPFSLLGFALATSHLIFNWMRILTSDVRRTQETISWPTWLLVYIVAFVIYMSLIGKKQERYVLPAAIAIDVLAGWGWYRLSQVLRRCRFKRQSVNVSLIATSITLILPVSGQVVCAWSTAPYYSTFYNPMLGGARQAKEVVLVGRGEGLDQAARFIQGRGDTRSPQVATWYGTTVEVLFADTLYPDGRTARVVDVVHPQNVISSDYVIFYINQLQRQKPKESIIRYVLRRPLLHVVQLAGIDYAYVFKGESVEYPIDPFRKSNRLTGKANLIGFQPLGTIVGGQIAQVRLYWMNDGLQPDDQFYARLVDELGQEWGRGLCTMDPLYEHRVGWLDDDIFEVECGIAVPPGTPPGAYLLRAGIIEDDGTVVGEVFPPPEESTLHVSRPSTYPDDREITIAHRVSRPVGNRLALIGYDYSPAIRRPAEIVALTLYWRALQNIGEDYTFRITLRGAGPGRYAEWRDKPVNGHYPTLFWQKGEVVRDPWKLTLPSNLPSGDYELGIQVLGTGDREIGRIVIANITVEGREHNFSLARPPAHVQQAQLGNAIRLLGYELSGAAKDGRLVPGQPLDVTLVWQAMGTIDHNYVVFVQLLDNDNRIYAQHDGQPGEDKLATTTWAVGEYVLDQHRLMLPSEIPSGNYRIIVGMYLPKDGTRLQAIDSTGQIIGDYIELGTDLYVVR